MYLIANWKLHKNISELETWLEGFQSSVKKSFSPRKKVIIAASDILLPDLKFLVEKDYPEIQLAGQDVSKFEEGPHTGETGAFQLKDFVKYCIVGHSERRAMGETDEDISYKINNLLKYNLMPIVCFSQLVEIRNLEDRGINPGKCLFAYEPLYAIGTGQVAPASEVERVYKRSGLEKNFIYGGSVSADILKNYAGLDFIAGYLIGSASLNFEAFSSIYLQS